MLAGAAGIGLFSSVLNGIFASDANNKSDAVLNDLAQSEKDLIKKQNDQLAAEQAQPAQIETRDIQEQMNQQLQKINSPFSNPLAISTMAGLKGKLG